LSLRRRSGNAPAETKAPVARAAADEDAGILRRTRLRLMLVSGLVTLVILVVLGAAVYLTVSDRVENGARAQLEQVALDQVDPDNPYGFSVEGKTAGLIPIVVAPDGTVRTTPGLARLPVGLPDLGSLAQVTQAGQVDIRNITLPDGTACRVISGFSASGRFAGYKVQWAQNRTGEVNLLSTLQIVLLSGGLIALLAALLAGYLYAGRALVPIRASIERRQGALQRQREFAANASHELRTPLTVIRASVEDLRRNRRSRVEEVGEALDDIDAEVLAVTALVEDMLLLARTDSGVVQLDREPLDLADVAADATSLLGSLGADRRVSVLLDPMPAPMNGDPIRLRQLVTILVDNAIRHGKPGTSVEVRVRSEPGAAVLEVEDRGAGIKPEDLPRLWDRFWRADDAPAGGTGLGLAIAKWIVDQHGGTIGANNRDGGGARFWVRLPVGAMTSTAQASPSPNAASAPLSGGEPLDPVEPHWMPGEDTGPA